MITSLLRSLEIFLSHTFFNTHNNEPPRTAPFCLSKTIETIENERGLELSQEQPQTALEQSDGSVYFSVFSYLFVDSLSFDYLSLIELLGFNLDAFGLLLISVEDQFGGINTSALELNSGLGFLMTLLIIFSGIITLINILNLNRSLERKEYLEIFFTGIAVILGVISFLFDSSVLMVLGILMGVLQSLLDLVFEYFYYELAPERTDVKVSHLQHCFELSAALLHNIVSLILVACMLTESISIVLPLLALVFSISGKILWDLLPTEAKHKFKMGIGLGKKSYTDSQEEISPEINQSSLVI